MRITINPAPARALVDSYNGAARTVSLAATELAPLLAEADQLLGVSSDVVGLLHDLADDLREDAKDLDWRIDYLEHSDRAIQLPSGRITAKHMHEPTMSASELAQALKALTSTDDHLRDRHVEALLDGVKAYARHDSASPEWNEIVDFWNEDLDDPALRSDLADAADRLNRIDATSAEIEFLLDELEAHSGNPHFLATVFNDIGPQATLELTELMSLLAWKEALSSDEHGPNLTVDPIAMRTTLSNALGQASQATRPNPRQPGTLWALGDYWFDQLLESGIETHDVLFGDDRTILHDGLPALFADGEFRTGVAAEVGVIGMKVMNHEITVERGPGSPLYEGFDQLETAWEDRGGHLLNPSTKDPIAAATVLAFEYDDGRTGVQIVADGDFDNMNRDRAGAIYAPLVLAGTIEAERLAVTDGTVTSPELLYTVFGNKKTLFDTIESHRATVDYGPELTMAFAHVVADTLPHVLAVASKGEPGFVVVDGATMPSDRAGIHLDEEQLKWIAGAIFRDTDARAHLAGAMVLLQRTTLLGEPTGQDFQRAAQLHGAIINGYNRADIADAVDRDAEIAAINSWIDRGWAGVQIGADLVPLLGEGVALAGHANDGLNLLGHDPLHEQLHLDSSELTTAMGQAQSRIHDVYDEGRLFVFDRAFERMQIQLAANGGDPKALPDDLAAIFEAVSTHPDITEFTPGETTLYEIRTAGLKENEVAGEGSPAFDHQPLAEHALASIAEDMTVNGAVLFEQWSAYGQGIEQSAVGESNE